MDEIASDNDLEQQIDSFQKIKSPQKRRRRKQKTIFKDPIHQAALTYLQINPS